MKKNTKTFPLGRNAKDGKFETIKKALQHPDTSIVERIPKKGRGDTKKSPKKK